MLPSTDAEIQTGDDRKADRVGNDGSVRNETLRDGGGKTNRDFRSGGGDTTRYYQRGVGRDSIHRSDGRRDKGPQLHPLATL